MGTLPFYLLTLAAGIAFSTQQVLNSNLRAQIGSAWWAGATSYVVGAIAMLTVAISLDGIREVPAMASRVQGFTWVGGMLGAFLITTNILMVPRLGAATTLALVVVGQLLAAATIDHFALLHVARHTLSPLRALGIMLLIGGVVLVRQ